jgi:hypothetical protein
MSESRREGRIIHLYSAVPSGTFVLRGVYRGPDQAVQFTRSLRDQLPWQQTSADVSPIVQ